MCLLTRLRHNFWLGLFCLGLAVFTLACTIPLADSTIEKKVAYPPNISEENLDEAFDRFYEIYGGVESLGQPITPIITVDGWRVQYFEKARLEYHPENESAYQITVGWLGDLLQRRQPPLPLSSLPPATSAQSRYFAETGHTLSGDFLTYFDAHGGTVRFGLPLSEPFILNGQLTQDFQSTRFWWTPQLDSPVALENIGLTHLETLAAQNKK